jgi:hypothetical protein
MNKVGKIIVSRNLRFAQREKGTSELGITAF